MPNAKTKEPAKNNPRASPKPIIQEIQNIPLNLIDAFPEHPFHVKDDADMEQLVASIREHGVLTPAIVRQKPDKRYELVSGHRRKHACELAGVITLKAEVRELDFDSAVLLMVESNLQRTAILPSEKAFSYKMQLAAMKRKVGRPSKNNPRPVVGNLESADILGEQAGECGRQIQRYIRLTELISPLLAIVDDGKMKLRPAVEISYLPAEKQQELLSAIELHDCTPSHGQAIELRKLSEQNKLTAKAISAIMKEEKPNQKERIVLPAERVRKLIPKSVPLEKTAEYVCTALEFYRKVYKPPSKTRNKSDDIEM